MRQALPMVAIIGRPNAGKSSLFNRLINQPRAIVAREAGTTRDPVSAAVIWEGRSFWLVDTAGWMPVKPRPDATAELNTNIQQQIEEAKAAADLILIVVDGTIQMGDEDRRLAKAALKTGKPLILVVNKSDKTKSLQSGWERLGIKQIIHTSAAHGQGMPDLLAAVSASIKLVKPRKVSHHSLAIVGRPNVGKSALFNRLTGSKALVSPLGGTTRDLNVAELTHRKQPWQISDSAGIRRPGSRQGLEAFSYLRTLHALAAADAALLIIDAVEPSVALDQKIAGLVAEAGRGLILVVNKWDLVEDRELTRVQIEQRLAADFAFVWWAPVIFVSASTGKHFDKLMPLAARVIEHHRQQIATAKLNQVLVKAVSHHPPSGLRNRQPKLKYMTQTDTAPPTFTLFGSKLEWLHWSYKRYLEAQLRGAFELSGTPLRLILRDKGRQTRP